MSSNRGLVIKTGILRQTDDTDDLIVGSGIRTASGNLTITPAGGTVTVSGSFAVSTLTSGSVLFAGSSGLISQDNSNFFWDDTNNLLGLGTITPGKRIHAVGDTDTTSQFRCDQYSAAGSGGALLCVRGRGTSASPTAVQSGDNMGSLAVSGYHSGGGVGGNVGQALFAAAENFTVTAQGTTFQIETTPTGSTTRAIRMFITAAGLVGIGTSSPATNTQLDVLGSTVQLRLSDVSTDAAQKVQRVGGRHFTNAEEDFALVIGVSNSTENSVRIGGSTGALNAATYVSFYTAATTTTLTGTERARFDSAGLFGLGTSSPLYHIDERTSTSGTSVHFRSGATTDTGGYLVSTSDSQALMVGGASFNGTSWVAKATTASIFNASSGLCTFFTNSGLTVSGTFTPTERMRLDASGNLGIATTTPVNKLDVSGALAVGTYAGVNTAPTNGAIISGSVGVGTSSPTNKFEVVDTLTGGGVSFIVRNLSTATSSKASVYVGGNNTTVNAKLMSDGLGVSIGYVGCVVGTESAHKFGIITGNATQITVDTSGLVGIGTTSPAFTVHQSFTTTIPTFAADFYGTTASSSGRLVGRRARGTSGAPTQALSGDVLVKVIGEGYHSGAAFSSINAGQIEFKATENFTATAQGTEFLLWTTANGTVTPLERLRVTNGGLVGIGVTPTSTLHVVGSINLAGNAASSFTTSTGALTITAGAASTWSTSAGALSLDAVTALNLGTTSATSVVLGRSGQAVTISALRMTFPTGGSAGAPTITESTVVSGFYFPSAITAAVATNATEAMRWVSGGACIGTTSPDAVALLQLDSTTKGFLPPRMTTTQRDAISTPPAGLTIYNTTTNKLNVYTTAWEQVTSA